MPKKIIKRILLIAIALIMLISLLSISASADDYVAEYNGTQYDSLQAALNAATAGGEGNKEACELDGSIRNNGELELIGSLSFTDRILNDGSRLFVEGEHEQLKFDLGKNKYIEADRDLTVKNLQFNLLDSETVGGLNDRDTTHEDVPLIVGGNDSLGTVTSTPRIDNPFVRKVYKTGYKGEGLYLVHRVPTGIYLDGVNGSDNADGTKAYPVKTFAKAKELLEAMIEENASAQTEAPDGIFVMGTVEVTESEAWSLPEGAMMMRYETFENALAHVTGELTLENITIDGLSENGIIASAPLIDADGGTLTIGSGAILRNNVNNTVSKFTNQPKVGGGVVGQNNASIIMNGGSVTGNEAGLGGGIGLYNSASLQMNSGTISENSALKKYHENGSDAAGGGVFLSGNTSMTFAGGEITKNLSDRFGGGISLGGYTTNTISVNKTEKATLNMTSGTLSGNEAKDSGGGIFIQANSKADISGGTITGNKAHGSSGTGFAGGGIYVNSNANQSILDYGQLNLSNAIITENQAEISGGGIAGCPTSRTKSRAYNGAAIYGNDAPAAHDVLIDNVTGVTVYGLRADHYAYFTHYLLGGGEAVWLRDGTEIYQGPEANHEPMFIENLLTKTSLELQSNASQADIEKAQSLAKVFITGNYSATRGGAIGNNGDLNIGAEWTISAEKVWDDGNDKDGIRPDSVKVHLKGTVEYEVETVEIPVEVIKDSPSVELSADIDWRYSWEDLPELVPEDIPSLDVYKNLEITYSVAEDEVADGYTCDVSGNMFDGYILTNYHEPTPDPVTPGTTKDEPGENEDNADNNENSNNENSNNENREDGNESPGSNTNNSSDDNSNNGDSGADVSDNTPAASTDDEGGNRDAGSEGADKAAASARTGDESNLLLWACLMAISVTAMALIVVLAMRKRRNQ